MIKKFFALIAILIFIMPFSAFAEDDYFPKWTEEEINRTFHVYNGLMEVLTNLGNDILKREKPLREFKLKSEEREISFRQSQVYNRVCVRGKTIVIGSAEKDKKFESGIVTTCDPAVDFDGVHVGANISVLEKLLGTTYTEDDMYICLNPPVTTLTYVYVSCSNRTITMLELYFERLYASERAKRFFDRKCEELGMGE